MMPDRYVEKKEREAAKPVKKANPYSAVKKKKAPVARPEPGQTQPNFAAMPVAPEPTIALDPMEAAPPPMPEALIGMPAMRTGPGSQDIRQDKYSRDFSRGKNLNVYQDPLEYETNLNTVMGSPLMRDLAAGADRYKTLREDFLKTAPQQTDLTPVMALADFLAGPKGTAQSGYKRPGDYEDMVAQLGNLMGQEQGARQQIAQLAYQQTGGLKKGQEDTQMRTDADMQRTQGYEVPQPRMGMSGLSPASMATAERWAIGENQKLLSSYNESKSRLDALENALKIGDVGSIQRSLSLAARELSGEKGVLTEQDVGRILPKAVGMDIARFQSYVMSNPETIVNPYIVRGLLEETNRAREALRQRYAEKQEAFNSQLSGSMTFGNLPSLPSIIRPNTEALKPPPPAPPKQSQVDIGMKELLKELRRGR